MHSVSRSDDPIIIRGPISHPGVDLCCPLEALGGIRRFRSLYVVPDSFEGQVHAADPLWADLALRYVTLLGTRRLGGC